MTESTSQGFLLLFFSMKMIHIKGFTQPQTSNCFEPLANNFIILCRVIYSLQRLFPHYEWRHEVGHGEERETRGSGCSRGEIWGAGGYVLILLGCLDPLPLECAAVGKALHLPASPGVSLALRAFCLSPPLALKAAPLTLRVQDTVLIPGKTVIVLLTDTFQQLCGIWEAERGAGSRVTQG